MIAEIHTLTNPQQSLVASHTTVQEYTLSEDGCTSWSLLRPKSTQHVAVRSYRKFSIGDAFADSSLPGDVGTKSSVDAVVTALEKLESHVDVLINCAGVNRPWKQEAAQFDGQHNDPDAVEKLLWNGVDDDEFQSTYSINVNGVYFFSTRMVPLLRKGTSPTVIVIASITAMMLQRYVHYFYCYRGC
jgi:NAD(P)-dependent dehydrogenase (short-subunit alcohol dehydrogenase family)